MPKYKVELKRTITTIEYETIEALDAVEAWDLAQDEFEIKDTGRGDPNESETCEIVDVEEDD